MATDVQVKTLETIVIALDGALTTEEVKTIVYSAYSYTTSVNVANINDAYDLMKKIDFGYFVRTKLEG
jgi:hypothetical protein